MGNRATVVFWNGEKTAKKRQFSPAVYLHWNGGPESVYGFLRELDRRQVRADQDYECARFVQLVGEFFTWTQDADGLNDQYRGESAYGLSLGVVNGPRSDKTSDLDKIWTDHGDNGLYLVNRTGKSEHDSNSDLWRPSETGWVRRFTERSFLKSSGEMLREWTSEPLGDLEFKFVEWDLDGVIAERALADADDYRKAFEDFYRALVERASKPVEPAVVTS